MKITGHRTDSMFRRYAIVNEEQKREARQFASGRGAESVWAAPGQPQQLTLRTTWKDAGAWGLLLADIARHGAKAYANEGQNAAEVLARIQQLMNAEFSGPTDEPIQLG